MVVLIYPVRKSPENINMVSPDKLQKQKKKRKEKRKKKKKREERELELEFENFILQGL